MWMLKRFINGVKRLFTDRSILIGIFLGLITFFAFQIGYFKGENDTTIYHCFFMTCNEKHAIYVDCDKWYEAVKNRGIEIIYE